MSDKKAGNQKSCTQMMAEIRSKLNLKKHEVRELKTLLKNKASELKVTVTCYLKAFYEIFRKSAKMHKSQVLSGSILPNAV